MSEEKLSLDTLTAAIKEKDAEWQPEITSVSELSLGEQKNRLGLEPTGMELQLATEFKLDKPSTTSKKKKKSGGSSNPGSAGVPSKWDWRNVSGINWTTSIKDQDGCGSCVAFGTNAALEALLRIRTYNDSNKSIDLSEAHLLFCGGGSCNGWHMDHACNYLKGNGVPDEACFPYSQGLQTKSCTTCSNWQSRIDRTKIPSWSHTKDVNQMKANLVNNGPQITGMAVYRDFFSYASGIYKHVTGDLAGYHCVCVVGYDDQNEYWICKNSWGTNWGEAYGGERGWFRIKYGECGIENVFGMWNMVVPKQIVDPCQAYLKRASYYLALYRKTSNRRYLCLYYRYMAAYYLCKYKTTKNRKYLCMYYRAIAAYYYCLYQTTHNRRYLCMYYRYMAAYYYCLYQTTKVQKYLILYRLYLAAYRRCIK